MAQHNHNVIAGVDTHKDVHVAAAIDEQGVLLGTASFATSHTGYGELVTWLEGFGAIACVGVEGTGSYGAGLARYLAAVGIEVREVNRPNRELRRRRGKSDTVDAEAAAGAVASGEARAIPKRHDGLVEGLRALRIARRSAIRARTQAGNQLRDLIVTLPDEQRDELRGLRRACQVERVASWGEARSATACDPMTLVLVTLARRHQALDREIAELDRAIARLCAQVNPALVAAPGVGPEVASALLVAAGENPERLRSEASFAALAGVSPIAASSGQVIRHRLNRGGNREANNALWRIAMVRLAHRHGPTIRYLERRRQEGKSDREIMRCLKRYIAREIFHLLTNPVPVTTGAELRELRHSLGLSLARAATALSTTMGRLSRLERGLTHHDELATQYRQWLEGSVGALTT